MNAGSHLLCHLNGSDDLLTWLDTQFLTNFLLEISKHEIYQEQRCLFFSNHLEEVRILPLLLLCNGLISRLTQFDTHGIGFLLFNDLLDQTSAFPRNMGGPHKGDLFVLEGQSVCILIVYH